MGNSKQLGVFVPTTNIWDVQQIEQTDVNSPAFKELLVRLYQNVNVISQAVNQKFTGIYPRQETVSGKLMFANPNNNSSTSQSSRLRQGLLQSYLLENVGAGVTTEPHGITITGATTFINIEGVANDTVGFNYYKIGWPSAAGATNIELKVTGPNIVITNNSGLTFTIVYVFLEYLQS